MRELVSVATDGAELFVDGRVLRLDGLAPGRDYEVAGVAFRTMDGLGTRRCTFATANDVHFGETVCGLLEGAHDHKVFRSEPGATPYPEVMSAAVVADVAGNTHRNRCRWVGGVALAEVACVKDFPGAWAEYHVHERGIAQVVRRAMAPAAVAWAERTRAMFAGHYAAYAMGRLEDRAFVVPTPSP